MVKDGLFSLLRPIRILFAHVRCDMNASTIDAKLNSSSSSFVSSTELLVEEVGETINTVLVNHEQSD